MKLKQGEFQKGASISAVLVALAFLSLLGLAISKLSTSTGKSLSHLEDRLVRDEIGRTLLNTVSCEQTFRQSPCMNAGQLVALKARGDNNTKTIVKASGRPTFFNDFAVRAECSPSRDGIVVRAVRLASNGSLTSSSRSAFLPDPLTGKVVGWQDEDSLLFGRGMEFCTRKITRFHKYITSRSPTSAIIEGGKWDICYLDNITFNVSAPAPRDVACSVVQEPNYWRLVIGGNSTSALRGCGALCLNFERVID